REPVSKSLAGSKPKLPAKAFQSAAVFFGGDEGCSGWAARIEVGGGGALVLGGCGGGEASPGSNPNSSASDFQGSPDGSVMNCFRMRVCGNPALPAIICVSVTEHPSADAQSYCQYRTTGGT